MTGPKPSYTVRDGQLRCGECDQPERGDFSTPSDFAVVCRTKGCLNNPATINKR
jgi:hypothetical protein